jgi:hypothetical protein
MLKIRPNPKFPTSSIEDLSRELGVLWRELALAITTLDATVTASGALTVKDEGTTIDAATTTLNFVGAAIAATDTSAGYVTMTADPDILMADTADILFAGFATTPYNAGTKSSGTFTLNEVYGNLQYCVNGGAFTLAPPSNDGTMILQITNNGSAGAITTSGWTKVTGVAPATTNGNDYLAYMLKVNSFSHLTWVALQ